MADIQSATAEIRQGKKRKIEEETTGQKYNVRICYTQGDHKQEGRAVAGNYTARCGTVVQKACT